MLNEHDLEDMRPEPECRPGGCSAIGCEGGFYCFQSGGSPRKAPAPAEVAAAVRAIVSKEPR